jgi:hypothetical protein
MEPAPSKHSADRDVDTIITTVQQIVKTLKPVETEDESFTVLKKVIYGLIMKELGTAFIVRVAHSIIDMPDPSSPLIRGIKMEKSRKGLLYVKI